MVKFYYYGMPIIMGIQTVVMMHMAVALRRMSRRGRRRRKKDDGDLISREMAIDAIAKRMPRSYTPDGSHPGDEEIYGAQEIYVDCIEAIEILPAVNDDDKV